MGRRKAERAWAPATQLVRGGTERSHHGETNEALYLTSGFVYDTAAQGNARTADEEDGYVYGRFGNPTVTMFEDRLALIEGAGRLPGDGDRHGGGLRVAHVPAAGGRPRGRIPCHVRRVLRGDRSVAAPLRDREPIS